jgi:hypothetical protein
MNKQNYLDTAIEKIKFNLSEQIEYIKIYLDDDNIDEITTEVLTKFLHSWFVESKYIGKDESTIKNLVKVIEENYTELAEVMTYLFKDIHAENKFELEIKFNGENITGFNIQIDPGQLSAQKLLNTMSQVFQSTVSILSRSFYETCLDKEHRNYETAIYILNGNALLPCKSQVHARFALSRVMFGEIVDEALSKNELPTVDEMKIQAEKGVFTL